MVDRGVSGVKEPEEHASGGERRASPWRGLAQQPRRRIQRLPRKRKIFSVRKRKRETETETEREREREILD